MATSQRDGSPTPLSPMRLETRVQDGQSVTVAVDPAGNTVYPTYVPPPVESPTSGRSPTSPTSISSPSPQNQQRQGPQVQEMADQGRQSQQSSPPSQQRRPRKVKTEPVARPTSTRKSSMGTSTTQKTKGRPRAGTTYSHLHRAIRDAASPRQDDDSSSSSSSSDSEDDEGTMPHAGGLDGQAGEKQRKKKKRHGDKKDTDPFRRFSIGNENYSTKGRVSRRDGRLSISLKDVSGTGYLAKALDTAAKKLAPLADNIMPPPPTPPPKGAAAEPSTKRAPPPKLNILIMIIGSRGDIQPFLRLGQVLASSGRHRVRIATHPAFRELVGQSPPLEFFSVGGDPAELMSFMVKNPGMVPSLSTVASGDISRRREAMASMFEGFWRACINATDDETDASNLRMMSNKDPFVADAIIANPPCFAHVHCAEALGIPLHLMFTFPYTPTQAFPHPLARISKRSGVEVGYANWISYPLVEMMVWQGLGDLVNEFRVRTLGLDPVSTLWAPGTTYRLRVPFTYLMSPGLVNRPPDWGGEVEIAGWTFLDLGSDFKPPDDLKKFLDEGEKGKDGEEKQKPVYIGFGSIVVDDPEHFTSMIFEAVELAGVRALVSKGWGGLGGDGVEVPENVFLLENTPHDWLFPRVSACVIHGGAGTTAIALKCGKPTMVVPFFGDQHFWGSRVAEAKAGPEPVPYKHLTAEKLAEGIRYCLSDEALEAAGKLAKDIEREGDGAENACQSFHRHLVLEGKGSIRCSLLPDRVAVWFLKDTSLKLSALAAEVAVSRGFVSWKRLRLLRHNEWNDFEGPGEPVTGLAGSIMGSVGGVFSGIGGVPYRVAKSAKKRKEKRKESKKKKREEKTNGKKGDDGEQSSASLGREQMDSSSEQDSPPPHVETATTNAINTRRRSSSTTNPAEDLATQIGRGAYKSASALARAPVDLSLALAQGFHNAPRLYGDDTVRRPTRVTGIKSGLRAARHEFVYGIYDGWTGVVRLPVRGAKERGVRGFASGVGMGLTGFVLKDIAAFIGPVGYTLKGILKEAQKGRQPTKYIRRARMAQGKREFEWLESDEERKRVAEQVVSGWETMRELWDVLHGNKKKRMAFRGGKKKNKTIDDVFENVEVAESALKAIRGGKSVESVLGYGKSDDDEKGIKPAESRSGGSTRPTEAERPVLNTGHMSSSGGDSSDENPFSPTRSEGKEQAGLQNGVGHHHEERSQVGVAA